MTKTSTLETKETTSLIASDKVEGTAVYGADQEKIGELELAMIDKIIPGISTGHIPRRQGYRVLWSAYRAGRRQLPV
jgi:hypothetical protein